MVEALEEVTARTGPHHVSVGVGEPSGGRWLRLAEPAGDVLDLLFADAGREGLQAPAYVGASVAGLVADATLTATWPRLLLTSRLPEVTGSSLAIHRHDPEGWIDQLAIAGTRCFVLPEDPAADHADTTVLDALPALHRQFVDSVVGVVRPWFVAVQARAPFGLRGMWGQLADDLCGMALSTARSAGLDE